MMVGKPCHWSVRPLAILLLWSGSRGEGEFLWSVDSKVILNVTKLTMKVNLYTPSMASFPQLTLSNSPLNAHV